MPSTSQALVTKVKVQLKLAIARLRMVQKRDDALAKTQRRAMAQLLEQGKAESARIRVENIIRSDIATELHEILELYCELLLARAGLLESSPTCDPGLEEAVKSIMYAAPKTEIKELQQVRALLADKFGKEFLLAAMENAEGKHVAPSVVRKLSVEPPRASLVQGYLEEIAKAYGVNWPPRGKQEELGNPPPDYTDGGNDDENPSGGQAQKNLQATHVAEQSTACADDDGKREELSKATAPRSFGPKRPLQKMVDAGMAKKKAPAETSDSISDGIPDVNELAKRFAALKR
ncbi:hypothetical protein P8C59_001501 [Phyllachora maydis]|uniref:DUF292-domain-containing protein n=1 Tax=Phyllachora maydis TaxID=1825666 RepID=A0AAD9HZI9_9PEZI|nr:hypothetical protein P8C59_001501 [Phyllachora maydis]